MQLRDYQLEAIANVYVIFGLHPAGPDDEPIVQRYREINPVSGSNGDRQNSDDGGNSGDLAAGASDDDESPLRAEQTSTGNLRGFLW